MKKFIWLMSRGALLSIGLLAFLASCTGTTDDEPSFTYSSGITAAFGMAQDAASSAPTWTNLPTGTVTYSIEAPTGGSKLNVTPTVGSDGVVTVPQEAYAATEDWTVKAAVGDSTYTATITIAVNPKEHTIGTVSYAAISANIDVAITSVSPSFTIALPDGATAEYTVAPALPVGLKLDPDTGEITGTPSAGQVATEHTVTLTLTGNYSGTATALITVTVDTRAPWVESLVYDTASVFVEVKAGKVASAVTIASPTLTKKAEVTSSITAEYSSVENRVAVVSSTGAITISAGTDLSGIDGNDFTFNIKAIDSGGAYADFQKTVTVKLQKVKSITFGAPPALTYGDAPRTLTAQVDAVNGADTTVTYSTSDANFATVDAGTGELTIVAAGEVTITATSGYDSSVKGEQTLTIAQKNINDLTLVFGGLDVTAYVGGSEFSGAITVVSGLIGSDTMAEALSFVPIPTGPVQVDENGALKIPVQNNTNNHGKAHNITVNGKGNYTGSQVIHVALSVLDSSFSYASGITAEFGMAQNATSPAPTWTNLPTGTVTYSIEAPTGGSKLNVTPTVGSDGVVTVPQEAYAATEDWTVKAAVGDSTYTATITIAVNPKEHTIGTVSYTAINADKDVPITPVSPSFTVALPDDAAAVYTVAPALPAGLKLDPDTGEITGTPKAEQTEMAHTVTLTLTGNYSGTATASITVTVATRAHWVESLVYDTASLFVEVKGGKVASAVTIASPTLTKKAEVTSSITAEYSSAENRVAVDSSTGEITISAGTDLSDIAGNDFTFNVKVIDSGGTYAAFQETVTVKLQKVKSITFGAPPTLTYGDAPRTLTAQVDAVNGADTTVTYSTSDANFATVDAGTGELTIVAAGEVTITATSGYDSSVTSEQTLTIAQKDIATVQGFSISVDNQTVTGSLASTFSVTINNAGLIAGTDYGLSIEKNGASVAAVTIDNSGKVSIANTISTGDTGTYTVTAAGRGNYTGVKTAEFVLTVVYSVGDPGPAGGRIFYVNPNAASDGWTYLEAASQDHANRVLWGDTETVIGSTGTAIGTGESNTAKIVSALSEKGVTDYAAKICSDLVLGGYDDWFLPSRDELNELYNQKDSVGGFVSDWYWSSSEVSSTTAWWYYFSLTGGIQDDRELNKSSVNYVRAVRAF